MLWSSHELVVWLRFLLLHSLHPFPYSSALQLSSCGSKHVILSCPPLVHCMVIPPIPQLTSLTSHILIPDQKASSHFCHFPPLTLL